MLMYAIGMYVIVFEAQYAYTCRCGTFFPSAPLVLPLPRMPVRRAKNIVRHSYDIVV